MKEINGGGREAFAHYLLNRDVAAFEPKCDVPRENAERRQMIRQSLNPYDARVWLEECAETQQILGSESEKAWGEGEVILFEFFHRAYTKWQATVKTRTGPKPTPANRLGGVLGKAGFDRKTRQACALAHCPGPRSMSERARGPQKLGMTVEMTVGDRCVDTPQTIENTWASALVTV